MPKTRTALGIAAGLGLGMLAGLAGALNKLFTLEVASDLGALPVFAVGFWGLFGAGVGLASAVVPPGRCRDQLEAGALCVVRVLVLGALLVFAARYSDWLAGAALRTRLAFGLSVAAAGAILWLASVLVLRARPLVRLLGRLARAWWGFALVALVAAAGLTLGITRHTEVTRFAGTGASATGGGGQAPSVMAIGIDSATWDIVMPLVEHGELPNLGRLMSQGTWGTLRSYDESFSPVVWTSMMTGKNPEQHGVASHAASTAAYRRVKSVWGIATELRKKCAVINVPGTYPVLGDCDVMLSGFPGPRATFANVGWLVTTGEPGAYRDALTIPLNFKPQDVPAGTSRRVSLELRDLPYSAPSYQTTPGVILRGFDHELGVKVQRAVCSVGFGRIELEIRNDKTLGDFVIEGRAGDQLFALERGESSDWLVATIEGRSCSFAVYFLDTPASELSLFVTPLASFPTPSQAAPADQIVEMLSSPYTCEAIGWGVFSDGRLLAPLCKHLSAAASARLSMGLSVLDRYAPDLFVYVFTLPDRIQHPMLKFAFPEVYRELAQTRGGEYLRLQPTPDQVAQFGDVVNETYRQVDRWMGKILDRAEADTWVVVVSDHGAAPGPHPYQATAGIHHPDGIYVIAKARVPDGVEPETDLGAVRGPELVLEDTTPIILHLLGLPVAADMIGQVPEFLVHATQAVTTIPSYEKDGAQSAGTQSEGMDPALEEQLRSLGYVE